MEFSTKTQKLDSTFMDEILKAGANPDLISFAGGLPNADVFPVEAIKQAAIKVLDTDGPAALQYNITEGYRPLREYIAKRYYSKHPDVSADNIIITNGSSQGIDMIARLILNPGDGLIMERPGYLGALQTFTMAEPTYHVVPVSENGVDVAAVETVLATADPAPKLFYSVPNFQNPGGSTYSLETREALAEVLRGRDILFIEDNPYGEIRFAGKTLPNMMDYLGFQVISLGSFSKVLSPGMRMGWMCASPEIIKGIIGVKGGTDMHSNYLTQRILYQYLMDNDFDAHIQRTIDVYREKCELMLGELEKAIPAGFGATWTRPEGGMFIWMTLPEGVRAIDLLACVKERGMYFIPGIPFYVDEPDMRTLRLNFSNSSNERIVEGVRIFGQAISELYC